MTVTKTRTPPRAPQPTKRRNWIAIGLVAVLLVAAAAAIGWWIASEDGETSGGESAAVESTVVSTEAATTIASTPVPAYVADWGNAWVAGDADAIRALYTTDGVFEDPTSGLHTIGAGIKAYAALHLDSFTFESADAQAVFVGDEVAVIHWTITGYESGDPAPDDPLVTEEHLVVFETDDGLISRSMFFGQLSDYGF